MKAAANTLASQRLARRAEVQRSDALEFIDMGRSALQIENASERLAAFYARNPVAFHQACPARHREGPEG